MIFRTVVAQAVLAGASVAAITVAPTTHATAQSGPICNSTGSATQCQSPGNAQISATPPAVDYQSPFPFFLPFG